MEIAAQHRYTYSRYTQLNTGIHTLQHVSFLFILHTIRAILWMHAPKYNLKKTYI